MRISSITPGIVACLTIAYLTGCAATPPPLPVQLSPTEPWILHEYRGARLFNECTIANGDPRRAALQDWLARNASGWAPSSQIFLPGTLITGPGFSLNLSPVGGVAVLHDGRTQYTKKKFSGVAPELRCPMAAAPEPRR